MKSTQRSVTDQKPNGWVVNPKDRGRKSIKKDNKVYLKDGQNFEIELFNPLKESVLSEIKVNGKSVSSTGLVLRPGERFYLDCFIDDKKKFVFKTYMVENTNEVKEAISNNGLIEIFFYKEETLSINNWKDRFLPAIEKHYHHYYPWYRPYPYYPWTYDGYEYWYYNPSTTVSLGNLTTCTTNTNIFNSLSSTVSYSKNITQGSAAISGSSTYNDGSGSFNSSISNVSYTSGAYSNNLLTNRFPSKDSFQSKVNDSVVTGRVEKGESSSQKFEEINMQFDKLHISSVIYQLLPESQKPVETKEIKNPIESNAIVDLIKKLKDLHNSGILTDEEFESKKKELLSKI